MLRRLRPPSSYVCRDVAAFLAGLGKANCDGLWIAAGFWDISAGVVQLMRKTKAHPKGTVLDDKASDSLFGRADSDWFFDFPKDEVSE
jgi:hypothetical protein